MTLSQPSPHLVADTGPRILSRTERLLGPRPNLTLVVQDQLIREIWVEERAPIIAIHDYDWGETDPNPAFDQEGFAFSVISWRRPAWMLGLSLLSRLEATHTIAK